MGLLKKIRAATLMETLVATVLIVVIFVMASLILNTLLRSAVVNETSRVETRLIELEYFVIQNQIELPYQEEFQDWLISISRVDKNQDNFEIIAEQITSEKTVTRLIRGYDH